MTGHFYNNMPRKIHMDDETFSEADIKTVGAYRYARDSSTQYLAKAMALDDGPVVAWDMLHDHPDYAATPKVRQDWEPYWEALKDPSVLIYCHNAQFEYAMALALMEKTFGIPCPDISRFRCTMSLARRAALPAKLEPLAQVLGLTHQKDRRGKALINKFSMMQKAKPPTKKNPAGLPVRRIHPEDEPQAFAEFVEYCKQDVRAEQEVARKLAYFDDDLNNRNYTLHEIINQRGVSVNLAALRHAQTLIDEETEIVSAKFRELTGFEVTQNARLLKWLHLEGVHLDNLQTETIEEFLENCV